MFHGVDLHLIFTMLEEDDQTETQWSKMVGLEDSQETTVVEDSELKFEIGSSDEGVDPEDNLQIGVYGLHYLNFTIQLPSYPFLKLE